MMIIIMVQNVVGYSLKMQNMVGLLSPDTKLDDYTL